MTIIYISKVVSWTWIISWTFKKQIIELKSCLGLYNVIMASRPRILPESIPLCYNQTRHCVAEEFVPVLYDWFMQQWLIEGKSVKVDNYISDSVIAITSGISQNSNLGPVFVNFSSNDISNCSLKTIVKRVRYADNTQQFTWKTIQIAIV